MKIIDMKNEFSEIINLLDKTSTIDKPMTFKIKYNNKFYVIKRHISNDIDCILVDKCKSIFGLNEIGNMVLFSSFFDISKKNNKIFKNRKNICKTFLMMNYIENTTMISNNLTVLENLSILEQYIKCALYRGIWRVTDFCAGNILISKNNSLYSIDENGIGKQKSIIKKRDLNIYIKNNITEEILENILDNFLDNLQDKIIKITNILTNHDKKIYIPIVEENIMNIRKDIYRDLEFNTFED